MLLSNLRTAFFFAVIYLISFSALSANYSVDLSAPVSDTGDYNDATITNSNTLSSGSVLGGYLYLGGTVDGNVSITNSGSITSTHSNYGVFYLPTVGNSSSLKDVSVTNTGSLITTGDYATPIYILGKTDGSFPSFVRRSFNFSLDNDSAGQINSAAMGVYIINGDSGTFSINNSGTISTSATSTYSAIGLLGGATTTINNSGIITADGSAKAINIDSSSATITNSGTITGNITLGSNAGSSLILNDGTVDGNITMSNAGQVLNLNGGSLNGSVNGAGGIVVNSDSITNGNIGNLTSLTAITIAASKTLDAATNNNSIRATNISLNSGSVLSMGDGTLTGAVDGNDNGQGTVNITLSSSANIIANLGAVKKLAAVNFTADSASVITATTTISADEVSISGIDGALILDSSVGINGNVTIGTNSNLLLSSGSFVDGIISAETAGSGAVQLSGGSFTTAFAMGTSSHELGNVTVMDSSTLTTSAAIRAVTISIGSDSALTSSSIVNGYIDFGTNSTLNLADGASVNGSINSGGIVGEGVVNSSGAVTILGGIGNSGSIAEINVASGSHLRIGNNDNSHSNSIEALNTNIFGRLDLIDATTISGNVTLGSLAKLDLSGYSQTINGDFTTVAGSELHSTIHSATSADILTVSGMATLAANTKLSITRGSAALGSSYVLVSGGSGSPINAINASDINVDGSGTNRSGKYIFTTEISGNELVLNVSLASFTANSSNGNAVYNSIERANVGTSGALYALQNYIYSSASDSEKNAALKSATPQVDNSTNRIIFNSAGASLDVASNRANAVLGNVSGIASGDSNDITKSVWGQVFGSNISQGNSAASEGYSANLKGLAFGYDKKIDNDFLAGLSFSYGNASIKSRDGLKQNTINSYQVNAYSGHKFGKFFVNNLLGFVWNDYRSSRAIPVAGNTAKADYNGQTYVGRIEGGFNKKLEKGFVLTPTAMITAARNSIDNYLEGGANTLNLNVKNKSTNFLEGRAGLALSNQFITKNNTIIEPQLFTSYGYDFVGAKQQTSSNFIGQTSTFDSTANKIARGSLKIGTGAKVYSTETLSLNLNYIFEHRTNYRANSVVAEAKYKF